MASLEYHYPRHFLSENSSPVATPNVTPTKGGRSHDPTVGQHTIVFMLLENPKRVIPWFCITHSDKDMATELVAIFDSVDDKRTRDTYFRYAKYCIEKRIDISSVLQDEHLEGFSEWTEFPISSYREIQSLKKFIQANALTDSHVVGTWSNIDLGKWFSMKTGPAIFVDQRTRLLHPGADEFDVCMTYFKMQEGGIAVV